MRELDWWGCYSGNLKKVISDDAFCHPAKFAAKLIQRIYEHGLKRGYWQEGDLIADPFAGVGIGGIYATSYGLHWIGVELEQKFVKLAEESFALHYDAWDKLDKPRPIIVQGDSRRFASIITQVVSAVVTSPPYIDSDQNYLILPGSCNRQAHRCKAGKIIGYGASPDQLAAMPARDFEAVKAVITSPPYASLAQRHRSEEPYAQTAPEGYGHRSPSRQVDGYSHHSDNLGNLPEGDFEETVQGIVTSPPYRQARKGSGLNIDKPKTFRGVLKTGSLVEGQTEGQLGIMPEGDHEAVVNGIVTSPPFNERTPATNTPRAYSEQRGMEQLRQQEAGYRGTEGQIGDMGEGDTYWQAVAQVYQQSWQVLKVGGCIVVVCKDFIRGGKRVLLCDQTFELLQAIGFKPLERIRAWLISEAEQKSLMPELVNDYRKERKSFFRRLAENKGSPRIDWEEVLILRKIS